MYKVLLVDDERIILEGISNIIDWESIGTELIGTARNGLEAYDKIMSLLPDIVICDIKMPGLNGLELVKRISKEKPETKFIILSGFSEFDYAKQAMEYGVKHYLLKPCNENSIVEALCNIIEELKTEEKKERFLIDIKTRFEQIQPYVKKQLLKEFITSKIDGNRGIKFYEDLFQINFDEEKIRLILFHLEGDFHYEHMFVIENLGEDLFAPSILSTNIGEHVLFLVHEENFASLQTRIEQLRDLFYEIYQMDMTVAVSEKDSITQARRLYLDALECLNHRFYLGEGSIISKNDIHQEKQPYHFDYDGQNLCLLIKSGNWEKVQEEISSFFTILTERKSSTSLTRSYVMKLFLIMIQNTDSKDIEVYMEKMSSLMDMDTIQQMKEFFERTAQEITQDHYERHKSNHSAVINKMIELVHEYLGNTELSLKWVANKVYMNADYLGKLFKQETGEKFSSYVTQIRINKAIEQIEQMDDVKVFTIAEMIGYGDNPQYFSQVFKKYTGYSPSEYKKVF
ncbi:AraC family transcriptional regulator [Bacillus sp. SA1-12]|uniref:response regulator transcription factor n=1 Tax=Bacillus sp. SA1-12 TaxID=1455638 RepID=UPI0006250246|nr:response regulator transcription factor [Bacillus sp. SA1-12]KKI91927.1 AraC family transcriptional regulator [Bacillus sp. SA1-12]